MAKSRRASTFQVLIPTRKATQEKEDVAMDENLANSSIKENEATLGIDGQAIFTVLETGKQISELADQIHSGLAKGDAAGVSTGIPFNYFKRKSVEASFVIGELISKLDERGDPDYPVTEKKKTSIFRRSYFALFKQLGKCIVINGDPVEQVKAKFLSWILTMSRLAVDQLIFIYSVGYRPIRIAATLAGLGLFEGMAGGVHDLSRQVDKLNKMKRRKDSHGATIKIAAAESLINWLTEGLLIQRYRDVDASIRSDVLKTLGDCIISVNPEIFLDNSYLRYIGWSLSDREERLRLQAVNILKQVYAAQKSALTAFTDRFKGRILEMATKDVGVLVRERSCELVDRMHSSGLLIVDDCVDLVRDLVEHERGEGINLHSSLHYTINQVIFGQSSKEMDISSICRAIATFTQNFESVQRLSRCVDVDQSSFDYSSDDATPVYIYLSIAHTKQIMIPTDQLLRIVGDNVHCDEDRQSLFTLLQSYQNYSDQQLLMEAVMNEVVQCRSDASTAAGIKLINLWRQSDLIKTRLDKWVQTAVQSCWVQVKDCLADFQQTRKLADAPFVPLSFMTVLQRQYLSTDDIKLIVDSMEQLEGLSLISHQRGRSNNKVKSNSKELLFDACHRLLLLLYNDLLWLYHHGGSSGEDRVDRLMTVRQAASLNRPIVRQDINLQKAAVAVLTDVSLLSKSREDVDDIINSLISLPFNLNEWKSIIIGRLYMAGLMQEQSVVPLLCSYRDASKTSAEICRAAIEKSKSCSTNIIVKCLEGLLSANNIEHLKYAISHYRPVLKGCGNGIVKEVESIHSSILLDKDLDTSGALLGFLLEELDSVECLSYPPAIFKQYRKVIDKVAKRKTQVARVASSEADPLTTDIIEDDHHHHHYHSDSNGLSMNDIQMSMTSPGMDGYEDGAPSLPNSPLDKIIRLE